MLRQIFMALGGGASTLALLLYNTACQAQDGAFVAVAANLQPVADELAAGFTKSGGGTLRFSFGASGSLAEQIAQGAPFDMLLAADESTVQRLNALGITRDEGQVYAIGRLALVVRRDAAITLDADWAGLTAAARQGRLKHLAIANPATAPYGAAALAALTRQGLIEALRPTLVKGENVSQTSQFVLSGSAEAGFLPVSLLKTAAIKQAVDSQLVPADWHPPLRQRMALLNPTGATAEAFYAFMVSPAARAILAEAGYELPPLGADQSSGSAGAAP